MTVLIQAMMLSVVFFVLGALVGWNLRGIHFKKTQKEGTLAWEELALLGAAKAFKVNKKTLSATSIRMERDESGETSIYFHVEGIEKYWVGVEVWEIVFNDGRRSIYVDVRRGSNPRDAEEFESYSEDELVK